VGCRANSASTDVNTMMDKPKGCTLVDRSVFVDTPTVKSWELEETNNKLQDR